MRSYHKLKYLVSALALGTVFTAQAANAADLLIDPPHVPEVVVKQKGGWYLRGDITYDFQDSRGIDYSAGNSQIHIDEQHIELDDVFDLGLGVGYQINEYFRVDATGEYIFETDVHFKTSGNNNCGGGPGTCSSDEKTSYTAFKLMANAYADLGHYNGFTPYVGVGIGGARVSYDSLATSETSVNTDTQDHGPCPYDAATYAANGNQTTTQNERTTGGADSWRFAWALHAGTSYDLTHNLKLDLGYTYSRIEAGDMFKWDNGTGVRGHDKGIDSHVIKAGLRYQIW